MIREINFDGIVGPSHNYAGLSLGNLAAMRNAGVGVAAACGGLAGPRQDAFQPCAGARPGNFRAAAAAGAPMARRTGNFDRGGRAAYRRQRHECLCDVGGQCRDGKPLARHGRRQVPPHRGQPSHHAAPKPRVGRDAGTAAAGIRSRRVRGPRPGSDGLRRRGRGQSYAPGAVAWRTGRRGIRLWRRGRPLSCPPARRSVASHRTPPPARSGPHPVRGAERAGDRRRSLP